MNTKLAFDSSVSDKETRRKERSEQFGFHADNSIADWLNAYSTRTGCPIGAVVRASLIYFAHATDPALGRAMLDAQRSPSLTVREVLLLEAVRLISKSK